LVVIRALEDRDAPFLREMLLAALFWRGDNELPEDFVLHHPNVEMYHAQWGRKGDVAFVAVDEAVPVGAVWCRTFTDDIHGDGFIDEATPELAIAVVASHRGRGIGTALLEHMHMCERAAGVARISISVNDDNPARALYLSAGYVDYEPGDGLERMVLELGIEEQREVRSPSS
jgi:GNAT superfamily N-acetyltransferase